MSKPFSNPTNIANRACQRVGAKRIAAGALFTEDSKQAGEIASCYDELRVAELRRNVWVFAIRTAVLRPIDVTTLELVAATYASANIYVVGSVVTFNGSLYISTQNPNKGNQPDVSPSFWMQYFGPLTVNAFDKNTTYFSGELVYTPKHTAFNVYLSLSTSNADNPTTVAPWSNAATTNRDGLGIVTTYQIGETASQWGGWVYQSNIDNNQNFSPAANPPQWNGTTTYSVGQSVQNAGVIYTSLINVNLNSAPPNSNWTTGPAINSPAAWVAGTSYAIGATVTAIDNHMYTAVTANQGINPALDNGVNWQDNGWITQPILWASGTTYAIGNVVLGSNNHEYVSNGNGNLGNDPTLDVLSVNWTDYGPVPWISVPALEPDQMQGQSWLKLDASVKSFFPLYPPNAGPVGQPFSRNMYQLPNGYLREAPQDPKAGSTSFLGAPTGRQYDDWNFQDNFFITMENRPIVFRFVADINDVSKMDPMFCEGLACRIGWEVCEALTQSTEKITICTNIYKTIMGEARAVNGIESAPDEPPLDDYIACRV